MTSGKSEHASKLLDLEWSKKGSGPIGCGLDGDWGHGPGFCYESEFNDDVPYIDTRTSRRVRLQEQVSEIRHVSECERIKAKKGHGINGCNYCLIESGYVGCGFDELCDAMCFACFKRSRAKNRGAAIASAVGLLSATQFKDAWYKKLIIDAECASCHIYSPALDARLKNTSGKPVKSLDATNVDACADYYLWTDKRKQSSNLPIPVPKGFDIIVWCGSCQGIVLRAKTCDMHQIVESKKCTHTNKNVLIRCEIIDASLPPTAVKNGGYNYESELRNVAERNFSELYEACCEEPGRYVDRPFRLEECNGESMSEHVDGILHDKGASTRSCIRQSVSENRAACTVCAQSELSTNSSKNAFWNKMELDSKSTRACEALSYVARVWCSDVPEEVSNSILMSLATQLMTGDMQHYGGNQGEGLCVPSNVKTVNVEDKSPIKSMTGREAQMQAADSYPTANNRVDGEQVLYVAGNHPQIPGPNESASAWVPKMMSVSELAVCKIITLVARTVNLYNLWHKYVSSIGSADELRKIFGQADDAIVIRCLMRLVALMSVNSNVPEDKHIVGLHGLIVSAGLCSCSMADSPVMHDKAVGCVGSTCTNLVCMDSGCLTGTARCIIAARLVCEYALWPSALRAIQVALDGLGKSVSKGQAKSWQLESASGRAHLQMNVIVGVADSFCEAGPRCFLHRISQMWASKHSGKWTVPPALEQVCCVSSYARVALSTTVRKAGHLMGEGSQEAALALASCVAPTTPERLVQAAYLQCLGQPLQASDSWLDGVKAWGYYTKRGMTDGLMQVEWEGQLLLCAAASLMTIVEASGVLPNEIKIITEPTDIISILTVWDKLLHRVL